MSENVVPSRIANDNFDVLYLLGQVTQLSLLVPFSHHGATQIFSYGNYCLASREACHVCVSYSSRSSANCTVLTGLSALWSR